MAKKTEESTPSPTPPIPPEPPAPPLDPAPAALPDHQAALEALIAEKVRAGLTRAQAIEVIRNQAAHDAALLAQQRD